MGKSVVITGCNRGIGLAVADVFASKGYHIWACMRTQNADADRLFSELEKKYAVTIDTLFFDVTDEQQVKNAISIINKSDYSVDVLVNNAGVSTTSLFGMIRKDDLRRQLDVNFIAPILLSQYISKIMRKNGGGSIINIGSVSGIKNEAGGLAYGASKAALIYATKTMANELGNYGIRVNCVSPGFIDTDMWKDRPDEIKEKLIHETPMKRQGTKEEVAKMVYFLASEDASFVTGQNVVVNGGR